MEDNKKQSTRMIKIILLTVGAFILALAIFWGGIIVGLRKASFNYEWGKNYHNLFERPGRMVFLSSKQGGFMDAGSAVGSVIKVVGNTVFIAGDDGVEKSIAITDKTLIRRWQDTVTAADIKIDEAVVVLGVPSSTGQIEARLIRLMPPRSKPNF